MTLMKNKLYILIDKNLDPIYGAVQGGHAVAKWLIEHGQIERQSSGRKYHNIWNNEYLIYLKADLEDIQNNYLELYAAKDEETLDHVMKTEMNVEKSSSKLGYCA